MPNRAATAIDTSSSAAASRRVVGAAAAALAALIAEPIAAKSLEAPVNMSGAVITNKMRRLLPGLPSTPVGLVEIGQGTHTREVH